MAKHYTLVLLITILFVITGCQPQPTESPDPEIREPNDEYSLRNLGGWGPERETFTTKNPSSHVAFNSITDNPAHGNETNFFRVKQKGAKNNTYTDTLQVEPGETYQGYIYFQNSAAPSLEEKSENARLKITLPNSISGAGEINAIISADNARPRQVWDSAVIKLPSEEDKVSLQYVFGSAVIHSKGDVDGQNLSEDELFNEGALLGAQQLDGRIGGKSAEAGFVTFEFRVGHPNFTIQSLAKSDHGSDFLQRIDTRVGQTIDFKVQYRNTGSLQQDNVVLKLTDIPEGVTYVEGSAKIANGITKGQWATIKTSENSLINEGINMGSFAPQANAFAKISLKIDGINNHDFHSQGQVFWYPKMDAITDNGTKSTGTVVLVFGKNQ